MKILLLDDDKQLRLNLSAFLEDEGYTVVNAASAEEALQMINRDKYKVAIVDINLPGIDGEEFINIASEKTPDTRYLIHTGIYDYKLSPGMKSLGLNENDLIYKPVIDMNFMVEKVKSIFENK
jgi:DNA-binding NtrC family response regulator